MIWKRALELSNTSTQQHKASSNLRDISRAPTPFRKRKKCGTVDLEETDAMQDNGNVASVSDRSRDADDHARYCVSAQSVLE